MEAFDMSDMVYSTVQKSSRVMDQNIGSNREVTTVGSLLGRLRKRIPIFGAPTAF